MKHYPELGSIRFSEEQADSSAPDPIIVTARCTCGLEYRLSGESLVQAAENLRAAVVEHLDEMQAAGEEIVMWPFEP